MTRPSIADLPIDELPLAQRLAASYAPRPVALPWRAVLLFDAQMAAFAAQSSEPMLVQMRLAWWRDMLRRPVRERPAGNPLLAALGHAFEGKESQLTAMVDGWERLVAEPALDDRAIRAFADGRSEALVAIGTLGESETASARTAGQLWALADLAAHAGDAGERAQILALAREADVRIADLPRTMRPLAVLAALARRAVERGGRPLLEGRGAVLAAIRVGLLGR